jgi:hypothetical protein
LKHPSGNTTHCNILIKDLPILTREEFRNQSFEKLYHQTTTTGSTGQQLVTQKTFDDYI